MTTIFLDNLRLDRKSPISLAEQLGSALRLAMLEGRLHAGSRMPSSRDLARTLGVSRNTVTDVYEAMIAEGFLEARRGAGTFVAPRDRPPAAPADPPETGVSSRAAALLAMADTAPPSGAGWVLSPGVPALDRFPLERWQRCWSAGIARAGRSALMVEDARGWERLRQMIAAHIGPSRGVACSPDQIVVLSGIRQALRVILEFLTDEGEPILLEDPCLPEALATVRAQKVRVVPMPAADAGADITAVPSAARKARLAIVTPGHQYPLGTVMIPERRHALLDWAEAENGYIVEDDYEGEFWIKSEPVPSLYSQAANERVIYLNSFSKTMFPSLRISYMVMPRHLIDSLMRLKALLDPQVGAPGQLCLSEFIATGAYNSHLREMRTLYLERRNILQHALESLMADRISVGPAGGGLHLCTELGDAHVDTLVAARMRAAGYGAKPLSVHYFGDRTRRLNGMVMGYAGWPGAWLKEAAATFDRACR